MQNVTYQFLEISIIIEVMTLLPHVFIHFLQEFFYYLRQQYLLTPNYKKGTLTPFARALGSFLANERLETGTSYAQARSIIKIQMFILIHFTNLVA